MLHAILEVNRRCISRTRQAGAQSVGAKKQRTDNRGTLRGLVMLENTHEPRLHATEPHGEASTFMDNPSLCNVILIINPSSLNNNKVVKYSLRFVREFVRSLSEEGLVEYSNAFRSPAAAGGSK